MEHVDYFFPTETSPTYLKVRDFYNKPKTTQAGKETLTNCCFCVSLGFAVHPEQFEMV